MKKKEEKEKKEMKNKLKENKKYTMDICLPL